MRITIYCFVVLCALSVISITYVNGIDTLRKARSKDTTVRPNILTNCKLSATLSNIQKALGPYTQFENWGHTGTLLHHSVWTAIAMGNYLNDRTNRFNLPKLNWLNTAFNAIDDLNNLQKCALVHDIGKGADFKSEALKANYSIENYFDSAHAGYSALAAGLSADKLVLTFNGVPHREVAPPCNPLVPPFCESRDTNNPSRHNVIGWNVLRGAKNITLYDGVNLPANRLFRKASDKLYLKCAIMSFLHYAIGDFAGTFDAKKVSSEDGNTVDDAKLTQASSEVFKNYLTAMGETVDANATYTYKQMVESLIKKTVDDHLVSKSLVKTASVADAEVWLGWNSEKVAVAGWLLGLTDPVAGTYVPFGDNKSARKSNFAHSFLGRGSKCHSAYLECMKDGSRYKKEQCDWFKDTTGQHRNFWVKTDHKRMQKNCKAINHMMRSVRSDADFFDCAFPAPIQPVEAESDYNL